MMTLWFDLQLLNKGALKLVLDIIKEITSTQVLTTPSSLLDFARVKFSELSDSHFTHDEQC